MTSRFARPQPLAILACYLPHRVSTEEGAAYRRLRQAHCAQGHDSNRCAGRLSLDRAGITLSCPLCGDARGLYPEEAR